MFTNPKAEEAEAESDAQAEAEIEGEAKAIAEEYWLKGTLTWCCCSHSVFMLCICVAKVSIIASTTQ